MKYGINLNIDVTKIDKAHIYEGKQGKYISAVVFVDVDNKDQYGNSGMIKQDWKDAPKGQTPILGNARVFWSGEGQQSQPQRQPQQKPQEPKFSPDDMSDDLPF